MSGKRDKKIRKAGERYGRLLPMTSLTSLSLGKRLKVAWRIVRTKSRRVA